MKAVKSAERPKALDTLVNITNVAIDFRFANKTPKLADMARVVSVASRLIRFSNIDERIETENAALLAIAKSRQLIA